MKLRAAPVALLALALAVTALAGCVAPHPTAAPAPGDDQPHDAAPAEAVEPAAHDDAGHDAQPARSDGAPDLAHEPPFPLEDGTLPSRSEARDFPNKYSRFLAKGDDGLRQLRAEGHLTGDGTLEDPYVLERFYVDGDLTVQSTDIPIILREGYVEGQLSLNYIGEAVYVHHVYADDLRVNENVKRYGPNTGGLWHDNHFAFVGQIRHFVGEFRDNAIGPRPANAIAEFLGDTGTGRVPDGVVFNFDGFHGADVHDNTFLGQVDVKLHGHNHADCAACPIHDHADPAGFPPDQEGYDAENASRHDHHPDVPPELSGDGFRTHHSVRHHSLLFRDNTIRVDAGTPWALRYNDRNHAGDDRTANSEPNDYLEDPHIHYQHVTFQRNLLDGAGFLLDIFNAEDDRHAHQNQGTLRLLGNDVTVRHPPTRDATGVDLTRADGITLEVRGNTVRFVADRDDGPGSQLLGAFARDPVLTGFRLDRFDHGELTFEGNTAESGSYGVYARALTATVTWALIENQFHTETPWRGQDVENPPEEEP